MNMSTPEALTWNRKIRVSKSGMRSFNFSPCEVFSIGGYTFPKIHIHDMHAENKGIRKRKSSFLNHHFSTLVLWSRVFSSDHSGPKKIRSLTSKLLKRNPHTFQEFHHLSEESDHVFPCPFGVSLTKGPKCRQVHEEEKERWVSESKNAEEMWKSEMEDWMPYIWIWRWRKMLRYIFLRGFGTMLM